MNHHVVQMLIAIVLIAIITRGHFKSAGLNLQNIRESIGLLTRGFFPVLLLFLLAGHMLIPILQGVPA
jgi:Na+/H+ antiporter NhaC